MVSVYDSNEKEYWRHVSPQYELPLAGEISGSEVDELNSLLQSMENVAKSDGHAESTEEENQEERLRKWLQKNIIANPGNVHHLMKLVGVSNKRMYLDLSYEFRETPHPEGDTGLCGCDRDEFIAHATSEEKLKSIMNTKGLQSSDSQVRQRASEVFVEYFIEKGLLDVIEVLWDLDDTQIETIVEHTIMPKQTQQQRAKLRGHGLEKRIASVLEDCPSIDFLPEHKVENPKGSDVNLVVEDYTRYRVSGTETDEEHSYDMLIRDEQSDEHVIGLVATVQSSDPGEFGSGKMGRPKRYRSSVEEYNSRHDANMELWGAVDGCGFGDNKGALRKTINSVDDFVQVKSIYKLVVALHNRDLMQIDGIEFDRSFYDETEISMLEEWANEREIRTEEDFSSLTRVNAGKADLYFS